MPLNSDPLFEIRMRQTYLGAELINMFYYRENTAQPEIVLEELAEGFEAEVLTAVVTIQNNVLENVDIRVREMGGVTEFVMDTSGTNGDRPGSPSNSFSAWGFTLVRNTTDIRHGSKRFGGVSEDDVNGNSPDVDFVGLLGDVSDALAMNITLANGAVAIPMIYRRGSFNNGEWFGGNFGVARFTAITSQVSRKVRPD